MKNVNVLKDVSNCVSAINQTEIIERSLLSDIQLGTGSINVEITLKENLFYNVLTEITGVKVDNEGDLFSIISELSVTKKRYDKIAYALDEVERKGYGIVTPSMDELILEEQTLKLGGDQTWQNFA